MREKSLMRLLCVLNGCLICGVVASSVLIADNGMSRMIELTTQEPYCKIHRDRGVIRSKLLSSDQRRVRQMTDDSIAKLIAICNKDFVHSAHQGGFIYPGTKWCGPGNNADNFTDLGQHAKEDRCCREHDHCPKYLRPHLCERGICNKSPFVRSHCDCDAKFRRCLQNINSETANTIGAIFFNVVQIICFRERTPCSEIHRHGLNDTEIEAVCGQWKYRPSEKYVPMMPQHD